MSNIYKGEFQDYEGNVVYPHTTADVVFGTDGKTVQARLNELGEGLDGVTGRTDSPEVDDSNILATSKAVHALQENFQAGVDSVYNAVVAKGSTPASKALSEVVTAINNINTKISNISCSEIYNNQGHDTTVSYTYTATEDCFVVAFALSSYLYHAYDTYGSGSVSSSVSGGAEQKIDISHNYQRSSEYVVKGFFRIFYMPKNSKVQISAVSKHFGTSRVYVGKLNFAYS